MSIQLTVHSQEKGQHPTEPFQENWASSAVSIIVIVARTVVKTLTATICPRLLQMSMQKLPHLRTHLLPLSYNLKVTLKASSWNRVLDSLALKSSLNSHAHFHLALALEIWPFMFGSALLHYASLTNTCLWTWLRALSKMVLAKLSSFWTLSINIWKSSATLSKCLMLTEFLRLSSNQCLSLSSSPKKSKRLPSSTLCSCEEFTAKRLVWGFDPPLYFMS